MGNMSHQGALDSFSLFPFSTFFFYFYDNLLKSALSVM